MDTFVRGDSFPFKTQITKKDGTPITLNEIESLFVTCRKMAIKESPILFQKKLEDVTIDSDGYCHILFNPEDTRDLEYGEYCYDIEITLKGGYTKTKFNKFTLTEETTIHNGENNGI